jgi:hypothetical protein
MSIQEIKTILAYGKSIIGIPYTWWLQGNNTYEVQHPFYIYELPTQEYLEEYGTNCAGLINLFRLKLNKPVKGEGDFLGGVYSWCKYFEDNKMLENFECNKNYPLGTLIIRKFKNCNDQGHMAVLYSYTQSINNVLHSNIIHAYAEGEYPNGRGQIGITNLEYSHFLDPDGYYDYVVMPCNWLK